MSEMKKPRWIEPCPFCGKADRIRWMSEEVYKKAMEIGGPSGQRIMCERCDVMMYDFRRHKSYEKYVDAAVEKWNSRASAWIPVSERLPESDGNYVLICTKSGRITTAEYLAWTFHGYEMPTTWISDSRTIPPEQVAAWLPLPDPYKEAEE